MGMDHNYVFLFEPDKEKRSRRSHRFGGGELRQGIERECQKLEGGRQEANARRFKGTKSIQSAYLG